MKTDYTLTPQWDEAFRMKCDMFIREAEEKQAKHISQEEARKASQRDFDYKLRAATEQITRVLAEPWGQLANDIRGIDCTEHRATQQQTNKYYADLADIAQQAPMVDMIDAASFNAGQRHATHRIAKLAIRLTTYFVLALGLGAFAMMVFA